MTTKTTEGTKEYVLKAGHQHNGLKDGVLHVYVAGEEGNDRVQLTERQAAAFADKFESVEDQKERAKIQGELHKLQQQRDDLNAKLAERGITLDDLLELSTTVKKPDPTPSIGTSEPTPASTTPAPIGSTGNPVNAAPAPAAAANQQKAQENKPAEKK